MNRKVADSMELRSLGQVIAERRYVLLTASGSEQEVVARIGMPQTSPDRMDVFCPYEVVGLSRPGIKCAFGIDAVQAIQLALKMIGTDLHYYRKQMGAGFYLFEEGDDLGFPEERWNEGLVWQFQRAFGPIYRLKLSMVRSAGSTTVFDFGLGQYAFQVQCPWRFVLAHAPWTLLARNLMVTGSGDPWDPSQDLQERALGEFFTQYDEATKSWINASEQLVVKQVEADDYGGIKIRLSGNYHLEVFPDGTSNEQWRLLQQGDKNTHLVLLKMGP